MDAREANETLTSLDLDANQASDKMSDELSRETAQVVANAFEVNETLTNLDIQSN
ncbi:unnamed protein product, partial [Rotaria magnacalcarata]